MRKLSIEEVHNHIISIAKAFDEICTSHKIPYYMIGGTMLGAIRHKGFIPWDDDMDFGVPIDYYTQLKDVLSKELPYPYVCCTYKNHPAVLHNFIKIEDHTTCIDDIAIELPIDQKLGLNIDIFPLNYCTPSSKEVRRLRRQLNLLGIAFTHSIMHSDSTIRRITKHFLRSMLGSTPRALQKNIDRMLLKINNGDYLGNLLGRWGDREIVPKEWYGDETRYPFEDTSFLGIKEYDKYLSQMYGNYLSLPPEEQRVAHVENVYFRE